MGEGKEEKENRGKMRRKGCVCAFLRGRYLVSSNFFILGLDPRFYIYKSSECYITSQVSAWPLYYFLNPMGQKYNLNDRFLIRNHADQKEIKISKGGKNGIIKPAEYS